MTASSKRLDRTHRVAAPGVKVGPSEEQLAADSGLLCRDGVLGGEPAETVPADAEVLGGTPAVQPLIRPLPVALRQPGGDALGNEFGKLAKDLVQREATRGSLGRGRRAAD
jgi:hypothetical protein